MRKVLIILMLTILCYPFTVLATNLGDSEVFLEESVTQKKKSKYTFSDLERLEGVSVVYVSKMMLSLAKGFVPDVNANGMDMRGLMKDLTGVHILNIENASSVKKAIPIIQSLVDSGEYEIAMKMKDDGDDLTFYIKQDSRGKESEMIMVNNEDGKELSIIRLMGRIDMEKLRGLTK